MNYPKDTYWKQYRQWCAMFEVEPNPGGYIDWCEQRGYDGLI